MTEHAIKIKEVYFKAVLSGEKTFEIRKNDRDYQVGDIIHFVPVDDECGMIIPHDPNAYKITYVFHGGEYGLEEGYCVFGIIPEAYDSENRNNAIDEIIEVVKMTYHNFGGYDLEFMTKYGNKNASQQAESYSTMMMYEIAGEFDDMLYNLEQMKVGE